MKILITSGSTMMPIDKVRGITNIFKGKTGFNIAKAAALRDHEVVLIGNPISDQWRNAVWEGASEQFRVHTYKTFDELQILMQRELSSRDWDACIHSAAVSDYKPVDVVSMQSSNLYQYTMKSLQESKVSSSHPEIYIKCVKTIKLVDYIREWGLGDKPLVKFKLEVDVTPEELFNRASKSRKDSDANFIVANRLNDFDNWVSTSIQIIDSNDKVTMVSRTNLPGKVIGLLEK